MKTPYMDRNIDLGPYVPETGDEIIICRCEEITQGEIRKAIHEGMFTMPEIRRYLRTGMGLCQGQTCGKLVKNIFEYFLNIINSEKPVNLKKLYIPTKKDFGL